MCGKPVWVVETETGRSYWALVCSCVENGIYLTESDCRDDYASFDLYRKTWLAYRREQNEEVNDG
jgi:hypothetical protein